MKNMWLRIWDGLLFFLRFIRDVFMFIMNFASPALSQFGLIIFLFVSIVFEVAVGKRLRRPTRANSPDQFPYTELAEGFSEFGSTVLLISGAKPLDAAIFVYADFYPHHDKKTFLPQTRLFFALNRGESYEIQIPWQLLQGAKLWSVHRLDIQIGNDTLFGGPLRTTAVMRLPSKCLEFLFEPASGVAAQTRPISALGRIFLQCKETKKKGRPFLACAYQGDKGPVIRLARSETEKNAHIRLDIAIQEHPNVGDAATAGQHS